MKKLLLITLFFLLIIPSVQAFWGYHNECVLKGDSWKCVRVKGYGVDECASDLDCNLFSISKIYRRTEDIYARIRNVYGQVKKTINVFGTEYIPNEQGRVYLQLLENQEPVNNALCLIDIFSPNLTQIFDDAAMTYLNGSEGLYYFDMKIPMEPGVYMLTAKCLYILDHTLNHAGDFRLTNGYVSGGSYEDTWEYDGASHSIDENLVDRLSATYYFYNVSVPYNISKLCIIWRGSWDDTGESVRIYLRNFETGSWDELPNRIYYYTTMVSNCVDNPTSYINDGEVRVRFWDTSLNWRGGTLSTDLLEVQAFYTRFGQIEIIRGGGEIHVRDIANQNVVEGMVSERLIHNHDYCLDNKTHVKELLIEKCFDSICYNTTQKIVEVCDYGCNVQIGECYPPPYKRLGIVIAIIAAIVIIVYLIRRFVW